MKLWIDDVRPAPEGYVWLKSVKDAKACIEQCEYFDAVVEVVDIDHDAGEFVKYGGEETGRSYPIHIQSMNVVGVQNMRAIIQKNHWKEV